LDLSPINSDKINIYLGEYELASPIGYLVVFWDDFWGDEAGPQGE